MASISPPPVAPPGLPLGIVAVRPPNRPAHERFLEETGAELNGLEERKRFLQDRFKSLRDQQSQCRSQRDQITEERNIVDAKLATINKEVNSRSEQVQKLRANIPYLSEERVNEQIKTLEDQMMKHHYKRSEENKIIQEVNRLKRSKKLIKDHNGLKVELENLRKRQRQIRERRDFLFKERGEVKKKEDIAKRDSNEIKEELEKLKVEIDQLFNSKRMAIADFRSKETEHKKFLYEKRNEQRLKRKEEKELAQAEKQRELDEIKANAEPFEEELKLLSNLITYCLRFELPSANNTQETSSNTTPTHVTTSNGFLAVPGANPYPRRGSHESGLKNGSGHSGSLSPASNGSSVYATPIGVTPASTPGVEVKEGGFLYKKEDTEDSMFVGVSKKTSRRNSRNERRNSKVKSLTHNPEIYSQFDTLGLQPPSSSKEVMSVINNLKEKQQQFEKLAMEKKASRRSNVDVVLDEVDGAAKNVTPDVVKVPVNCTVPTVEVTELENVSERKDKPNLDEAFPCLPKPLANNSVFFSPENGTENEQKKLTGKDSYKNNLKIVETSPVEVQEL